MAVSLNLSESITMMKQSSIGMLLVSLLLVSVEMVIKAIFNPENEHSKLLSSSWLFFQTQLGSDKSDAFQEENDKIGDDNCFDEKSSDDTKLCSDELQSVMKNLGLHCSQESENLRTSIGSDEILNMFDEKEPSLEEVKEAFDVFDENGDGFIDTEELLTVLSRLGLKKGYHQGNCKEMIKTCDKNGDGRIDFREFVQFLESSFC